MTDSCCGAGKRHAVNGLFDDVTTPVLKALVSHESESDVKSMLGSVYLRVGDVFENYFVHLYIVFLQRNLILAGTKFSELEVFAKIR